MSSARLFATRSAASCTAERARCARAPSLDPPVAQWLADHRQLLPKRQRAGRHAVAQVVQTHIRKIRSGAAGATCYPACSCGCRPTRNDPLAVPRSRVDLRTLTAAGASATVRGPVLACAAGIPARQVHVRPPHEYFVAIATGASATGSPRSPRPMRPRSPGPPPARARPRELRPGQESLAFAGPVSRDGRQGFSPSSSRPRPWAPRRLSPPCAAVRGPLRPRSTRSRAPRDAWPDRRTTPWRPSVTRRAPPGPRACAI